MSGRGSLLKLVILLTAKSVGLAEAVNAFVEALGVGFGSVVEQRSVVRHFIKLLHQVFFYWELVHNNFVIQWLVLGLFLRTLGSKGLSLIEPLDPRLAGLLLHLAF